MKKFLVSMMAVITAVLLVACSNASNKDLVHVGVLQYVEHPSLSATRKGSLKNSKRKVTSTVRTSKSIIRMHKEISLTCRRFLSRLLKITILCWLSQPQQPSL